MLPKYGNKLIIITILRSRAERERELGKCIQKFWTFGKNLSFSFGKKKFDVEIVSAKTLESSEFQNSKEI